MAPNRRKQISNRGGGGGGAARGSSPAFIMNNDVMRQLSDFQLLFVDLQAGT